MEKITNKSTKRTNLKENLSGKKGINPWVLSTFLLGILVLILMVSNLYGSNTISEEYAGDMIIDLVESQGGDAELIEVVEESGLYKIIFSVSGEQSLVYVTLDGKNIVNGIIPISTLTQQTPEGYSEEELEEISIFIDCLAEEGVKIYGANWCGWTKKLVVETLGGFDIVKSIYVECTENEELCSSEDIQGYPTIKINGGLYDGERTFEGLSEATGCPTPDIEIQTTSTDDASCS